MNRSMRWRVLASLVLALCFAAGLTASGSEALYGSWVEHFGRMPDFSLSNNEGRVVSSAPYMEGLTIISFVTEECEACKTFLNRLSGILDYKPNVVTISPVISDTMVAAIQSVLPDAALLVDPTYTVADLFDVLEAPSTFVFSDGVYYGQLGWNWTGPRIETYVEAVVSGAAKRPKPRGSLVAIGQKMPMIVAHDETGTQQVIHDFDRPTLLVFASANCGHCRAEIDELPSIASGSPFDVLVVGRESYRSITGRSVYGDVDAVYDAYGTTFDRFGIWGTPTHALVCGNDIVDVWIGRTSIDTLQARVNAEISRSPMCSVQSRD